MDIVRAQCFNYVKDWDYHTIRKQKNRPNSVTGKPFVLYYAPSDGTKSYGHMVDQELVNSLLSTFTNHGMSLLIQYVYCTKRAVSRW